MKKSTLFFIFSVNLSHERAVTLHYYNGEKISEKYKKRGIFRAVKKYVDGDKKEKAEDNGIEHARRIVRRRYAEAHGKHGTERRAAVEKRKRNKVLGGK